MFARAKSLAPYFLEAVWSLRDHPRVKDLRGYGLLAGIEIDPQGAAAGVAGTKLQKSLFRNGLHAKITGDTAILSPQFIVEKGQIDEMIDIFRKTLDSGS